MAKTSKTKKKSKKKTAKKKTTKKAAKKSSVSKKKKTKSLTNTKTVAPAKAVEVEIVDADVEAKVKEERKQEESNRLPARTDPLGAYLAEVRRYPLLTPEEERRLAVLYYESKDPKAAEKLITANLRFVVKIAAEYSKFGTKLIDLIQEGNVGLMHAVREFNPYKDVRLITYAVWWIRGYIREYLMKHYSVVKIGTTQAQKKLYYNLQKEIQKLELEGEKPTVKLLSEKMGVPEKDVKTMQQRMGSKDVSLDAPLDPASNSRLMDLQKSDDVDLADEVIALKEQLALLAEEIEKLKPTLNEKEEFILENRLLADNPKTLQEIGDHYGITRERTRQLEARVIKRLKEAYLESIDHSES